MSEKKEHILDVAESLFAVHGFEGTTTRIISERADVNIAMLSYYFGSKEKLLKASLDRYANQVYEMMQKIGKGEADLKERIKKWNLSYIEFAFDNPRPVIIASRERSLLNDRPDILENIENVITELTSQSYNTIEEGKKSGVFRDVDTELMMQTLSKTVESLIVENVWIRKYMDVGEPKGGKLFPEDFENRVKDHVISLIDVYLCK